MSTVQLSKNLKSIKELSEIYNISAKTIQRWTAESRRLAFFQPIKGGKIFIDEDTFKEYMCKGYKPAETK